MNKIIKQTDILIVGAGPSGCMAANILKDAGRNVTLLDKNNFPRHKPCAGGLTPKTVDELPFEITDLKQHVCHLILHFYIKQHLRRHHRRTFS